MRSIPPDMRRLVWGLALVAAFVALFPAARAAATDPTEATVTFCAGRFERICHGNWTLANGDPMDGPIVGAGDAKPGDVLSVRGNASGAWANLSPLWTAGAIGGVALVVLVGLNLYSIRRERRRD
ncbi:hypothetical protein Afil01_24960 [Actinorhabdospora filicis]|uniref:Uncharacterized protein n=1 Tax=Actinorhabdospora filicis TaxID=1785913 RepID=A0A9W6W8L5_9ACTN|nr:hypothetical protein [Actinorhabdospora filicis]GLZ77689.1 hypothetical protein Afil01_24960 [Actinorhabdospora filicis]